MTYMRDIYDKKKSCQLLFVDHLSLLIKGMLSLRVYIYIYTRIFNIPCVSARLNHEVNE